MGKIVLVVFVLPVNNHHNFWVFLPQKIISGTRTQLLWPKNVPKLIQSMKKYVGYARVDPKDKQSLQVNDFEKVPFLQFIENFDRLFYM